MLKLSDKSHENIADIRHAEEYEAELKALHDDPELASLLNSVLKHNQTLETKLNSVEKSWLDTTDRLERLQISFKSQEEILESKLAEVWLWLIPFV